MTWARTAVRPRPPHDPHEVAACSKSTSQPQVEHQSTGAATMIASTSFRSCVSFVVDGRRVHIRRLAGRRCVSSFSLLNAKRCIFLPSKSALDCAQPAGVSNLHSTMSIRNSKGPAKPSQFGTGVIFDCAGNPVGMPLATVRSTRFVQVNVPPFGAKNALDCAQPIRAKTIPLPSFMNGNSKSQLSPKIETRVIFDCAGNSVGMLLTNTRPTLFVHAPVRHKALRHAVAEDPTEQVWTPKIQKFSWAGKRSTASPWLSMRGSCRVV